PSATPRAPPLSPYTTLFRSQTDAQRPGRHVAGQGLRGQTPDRLHRGVVQDGVGGGIGDCDGADHPVGPDDDLDVDRAAEPAPTRGERVTERLLDAVAEPPEIGAVLGAAATRAAGAAVSDGHGSPLPSDAEGIGAERAGAEARSARAETRPAGLGAGGAAGPLASPAWALSVRSMKSAPRSLSPLTASRTASRTAPWSTSEAP